MGMDSNVRKVIDDFFAQYHSRTYRKGQILIHANDNPTHIFHLLEGRVKQYNISYRGDEVVLNEFKPPAFFPMSYAMNRTPNVYFYEAETDVELQLAPLDDATAFLKSHPDVLYDLLGRVYRGADGLLERLAHLMAGTARTRILYELLIQTRRFGTETDKGVKVPSSESDIGARAGLARETVNREMNKLKRDGFIDISKGEITIKDPDRLAETVSREL
jgi:CRP-like cAMP-binding protein